MPLLRDPWRWAAALLIAVSALVVVLLAVRGVGPTAVPAQPSSIGVPLPLDHLAAPLPPPRGDAAMAFDAPLDEVVLFGADAVDNPSGSPLTDTWVLKGRRWSERHPVTHPPPMGEQLMAYDTATQTCVLVGLPSSTFFQGTVAQTWAWDGTNWTRSSDLRFSAAEILQGIAADPTTGHILLVTAPNTGPALLRTWTWDGNAWMLQQHAAPFHELASRPSLATISRPTPSGGQGPGVLMIFGTSSGAETWFWAGAAWSKQAEGHTPPYTPLTATTAGDPTVGTVVLIGVPDDAGNSTWIWDGSVWNQGADAPPIVYGETPTLSDTASGHPIVIGDVTGQLDSIWTWDGLNWVPDRGV